MISEYLYSMNASKGWSFANGKKYIYCFLFLEFIFAMSESIPLRRLPKLVAFDLDGTIWNPEMYQLWSGGPPFKGDGNGHMTDRSGTKIELLGVTREILHEMKTKPEWRDTKVAWVSCTDEPEWAEQLLGMFKTSGGDPIGSVVHSNQIFKANKKTHFQRLKEEFPDIEYSDMLFFDNEMGNIR